MTNVEKWRRENNLTYDEMGNILGCSRQWCFKLCNEGIAAATKMSRLIALSKGVLTVYDFIPAEHRQALIDEGYDLSGGSPDVVDEEDEDLYIV